MAMRGDRPEPESGADAQRGLARTGAFRELFLSIYDHGCHTGVVDAARRSERWSPPWRALLFGFHPDHHRVRVGPGPTHLLAKGPRRRKLEESWADWLASQGLPVPSDVSEYAITCRDLLVQWLELNGRENPRQHLAELDGDRAWQRLQWSPGLQTRGKRSLH